MLVSQSEKAPLINTAPSSLYLSTISCDSSIEDISEKLATTKRPDVWTRFVEANTKQKPKTSFVSCKLLKLVFLGQQLKTAPFSKQAKNVR